MKYLKFFEQFDWDDEDEEEDTHHVEITQFFNNLRKTKPFDIIYGNMNRNEATYYIDNVTMKVERNYTTTIYIKVLSEYVFSLEEQYHENYEYFLNEVMDYQSILAIRFKYENYITVDRVSFIHSNNNHFRDYEDIDYYDIDDYEDNFIFKNEAEYNRFLSHIYDKINIGDKEKDALSNEYPYVLSNDIINSLIGKEVFYQYGKEKRYWEIINVDNRNPSSVKLFFPKNSTVDDHNFKPSEIIKMLKGEKVKDIYSTEYYTLREKPKKKWWRFGI